MRRIRRTDGLRRVMGPGVLWEDSVHNKHYRPNTGTSINISIYRKLSVTVVGLNMVFEIDLMR